MARLRWFADHHLGPRETLVVELQQPAGESRAPLRRVVNPLHHCFVHLLHVLAVGSHSGHCRDEMISAGLPFLSLDVPAVQR